MGDGVDFDTLLRNNRARVLLYVFALAFILRTVYLFEYARSPFFWVLELDSLYNDNQALAIVHGHVSHAAYWRAPLYSYFLAAVYATFGHSVLAARCAQELIGCLSCCLTYLLGVRAMRPTAALIGTVGMAFYGPMIFNDGELQSPSIEVFLDLCALIAVADGLRSNRPRSWLIAGLLVGLSAIARPTILLIVPLVLIAQLRARNLVAIVGSIFVACSLLAPMLVTARNVIVAHDPVFIASQGGINLFVGNHDNVDGFTPTTPKHYEFDGAYQDAVELYGQKAAEEALNRPLSASQVNAYWTQRTIQWWRAHPIDALDLAAKKLVLMWTRRELRDNVGFDYLRKEWTPILWLAAIGFWLAGPLGIAGIAAVAVKRDEEGEPTRWLLAAFVLVTMTSFVLFFAAERFRLPVVPALLLLGGLACTNFTGGVERSKAGWICAAGAAGCLLVNVPWYNTEYKAVQALDYWSCGNRYVELKRYPEAVRQFQVAVSIDPRNDEIWLNLGSAFYYEGEPSEAIQSWRTATAIAPSASAYYDIGICEQQLGLRTAAAHDLRTALAIDPGDRKAQDALAGQAH